MVCGFGRLSILQLNSHRSIFHEVFCYETQRINIGYIKLKPLTVLINTLPFAFQIWAQIKICFVMCVSFLFRLNANRKRKYYIYLIYALGVLCKEDILYFVCDFYLLTVRYNIQKLIHNNRSFDLTADNIGGLGVHFHDTIIEQFPYHKKNMNNSQAAKRFCCHLFPFSRMLINFTSKYDCVCTSIV